MGSFETNFSDNLLKLKKNSIRGNTLENVICRMAAILSRGWGVGVGVS